MIKHFLKATGFLVLFLYQARVLYGQTQLSGTPGEKEEIRKAAVRCLKEWEDLLKYVSQKGTLSEDVEEVISSLPEKRIFSDSLVTLEDDLFAIRADTMFPKDVSVAQYLNDLHLFYVKSMDGNSITFSDLRISEVATKGQPFIRVLFQVRYRERNKDFDQDYPVRSRIAGMRLRKENGQWEASISGIRFLRTIGPDAISPEVINRDFSPFVREKRSFAPSIANAENDTSDFIQKQLRLQKENDSLYAAELNRQLIQTEAEKRKERLFSAAIAKGDSLFSARNFPDAILAFSEARTEKPFEAYPRDKIRELTRLLQDPESDPVVVLKKQLALARKKLRMRDYENALEEFQIALKLAPEDSSIRYEIQGIVAKLRIRDARRALYMAGNSRLALKEFSAESAKNASNPDFFYERARCYLHTGDRKKALPDLSRAISLDGDFKDALIARADLYRKESQLPQSIADYTALTSLEPDEAMHFFLKSEVLVLDKDLESAARVCQQAIGLQPSNAQFLAAKAGIFRKLNKMTEALQLADSAIRLRPDYASGYFEKGLVLYNSGEEKASLSISRAQKLGLSKEQTAILLEMADELLAEAGDEKKKEAFDKAIALYTRSLVFRPKYPPTYMQIADLNQRLGQYSAALKAVDNAIFHKEDFVEGYMLKAELLLRTKEYQASIEPFRKAQRYNRKNPKASLGLGKAYSGLQRYDSALVWFGDAVRLDPFLAEAFLESGICHFRKEHYVRAGEDFDKCLRNNAKFAEAHFYKGLIHKAYNRFSEAIDDFQNAADLGYQKYDCTVEMGICYEKMNKSSRAWETYSKAIEINRDSAKAYLLRGMLDLKSGHYKDARESLDEGLKIDTSLRQASCRVELGVLSLKYDDFQKAEDCFRKVLAFDKFSPKGNIGLGICLYRKGDQDNAMKLFEQGMLSKILDYADIKELPGMEKVLKDKRYKQLKEKYYP